MVRVLIPTYCEPCKKKVRNDELMYVYGPEELMYTYMCMYVCLYVHMYVYVCMFVCTYVDLSLTFIMDI